MGHRQTRSNYAPRQINLYPVTYARRLLYKLKDTPRLQHTKSRADAAPGCKMFDSLQRKGNPRLGKSLAIRLATTWILARGSTQRATQERNFPVTPTAAFGRLCHSSLK